MEKPKIVVMYSDNAEDAGTPDVLVIPPTLDLDAAEVEYNDWYYTVYAPNWKTAKWLSFADWLCVYRHARVATETDNIYMFMRD